MVDIGYVALCLALIASGWALVAAVIGGQRGQAALGRSAENGLLGFSALLTVAVGALWYALLQGDFRVQYVAENTNRSMSVAYRIAALWGGQSGSLLFWNWILSLYGAAVVIVNRHRYRALIPYVVAAVALTGLFFSLLHVFASNPFRRLPFLPEDGRGLNPLLQHPLMSIHPPMLYLGMVGMVVPYGFAIAALVSGRLHNEWLAPARRWMLIPWCFLGIGLLLGGKWAYVVLGWGGYWGWDPVENSSLMPWLAGTAFLHSLMVQERKGMLKRWNMAMAILAYVLCIMGTFLTRSGVISSVHAFAQSNVGPFFAVFLTVLTTGSVLLLIARTRGLRSEARMESLASRETAFLLNNWILLGVLFAVLWGTLFPLVSEWLSGTKVTVGPPFFNQVNTPIGLGLLLLTGVGPLLAWGRTSGGGLGRALAVPAGVGAVLAIGLLLAGVRDPWALLSLTLCAVTGSATLLEFYRGVKARQQTASEAWLTAARRLTWRHRRRYGGYLVHLGVVLLFVGFTGKLFTEEQEVILDRGEAAQVGAYTLRYEQLTERQDAQRTTDAAVVSLWHGGQFMATLLPERRFYPAFDQGTTEVAIYSSLARDVYVVLVGFSDGGGSAKFQVFVNPLVAWVWIGGVVMVLGTLWAVWPGERERRQGRAGLRQPVAPAAGS